MGGGGGGGGGGWRAGGRRVKGGLSLFSGCFLNGPKVFFLKNTANSVSGRNSWRSSYADRRLANLTGFY